jgi:YD repeat-containing protein
MSRCLLQSLALAFFCGLAVAQMPPLPVTKAIAELPGPPKNPPIFSQMTLTMQGELRYADMANFKGPVAAVRREQILLPSQRPNPYHTTTTMKFDGQGHLIERIDEDSLGSSTLTNVFLEGKLQSQTVEHRRADAKTSWKNWARWTYDAHGRLSEYRAGQDQEERNHYLNFKYDSNGRLLGCEYRQSGAEWPFSFTEITYSGNSVDESSLDEQRRKVYEQIQVLDGSNRVIDLKVYDGKADSLKLWYHVAFKYDEKGRVVEQNTDPFKLGDGDDDSPIPGKLIVRYDDQNRMGEQEFYDIDGKLTLHTRFRFDRDGIPTKFSVLDDSGKEVTRSEFFIDPDTHKHSSRRGSVEWEVIYDDHGNWTERRRWFAPADGSPRIMTTLVRQSITY